MSAIDMIVTEPTTEPAPPVDLSDHIMTTTSYVDGFRIQTTVNGRAVDPEAKRHPITGKANAWDVVLAGMLAQSRGAEAIIPPIVKLGNDGAPRAQYATAKINAARLRLSHSDITRVKVERLDGSVDGSTGNVTFGALLVTVTPRNRR